MEELAVITMGKTPAVATQFIDYLRKVERKNIKYIFMISTSDPIVYGGSRLAKISLEERYSDIFIHIFRSDVEDLASKENMDRYINEVMKGLKDWVFYPSREITLIHLCIAGGRKNMTIISTIFSLVMRPVILYHIINRKVDVDRSQLYGWEDLIVELSRAKGDKEIKDIYSKLKNTRNKYGESIDDVLHPPSEDYEVIKIYVPPYPSDYMDFIKFLISNVNGASVVQLKRIFTRADTYIKPLYMAGLIEYEEKGIIKPTDNLLRYKPFFE